MNKNIIIGMLIVAVFLVIGSLSFIDSKVEYADFNKAAEFDKTCQVKGTWVKEKDARFDAESNQFIFYMVDEKGSEMKVVLDGARPNNFEMAESVVAKGRIKDGYFHAKSVLTKCPSKYEGNTEDFHTGTGENYN